MALAGWLSAGAVIVALAFSSGIATAQGDNKPAASNPVGAGWGNVVVKPSGETGQAFSPEQRASVERVSNYFDQLTTLRGQFEQTDPDGSKSRGKFYVERPGKFRFEYARPSRKVVISDGRFLAIEEQDTETEDTYDLSDTPFRMLLKENVNLLEDAEVLQIDDSETQISLILRDKDPDVGSAIKVVMGKQPDFVLQGWITRDAQGLETVVEIGNTEAGGDIRDALFERSKFFRKAVEQR